MPTEAPVKPSVAPAQTALPTQQRYPNFKIIVLDDDFNTFQHVTDCLLRYIPGMTLPTAQALTIEVDQQGQAIVWVGPQEPAELYHLQLSREGLTMAPLEAA